jgi:hypothetical protein
MSEITTLILSDQYLAILAVTIFFTFISIFGKFTDHKKALEFGVLSMITFFLWLVCGIIHLAVSPTTSPIYIVAYLWFGIGVVFALLAYIDISAAISESHETKTGGYGRYKE